MLWSYMSNHGFFEMIDQNKNRTWKEHGMNYLVVVAHPDDEVLGAGATIHKLIKDGHKVAVAFIVTKTLMSKTDKTEPLLAA